MEEAQQCHKAVPPSKTVHLKAPSFAHRNSCSEDDDVIASHPSTKPEAGGVRAGAEPVPGRRQADLQAALPICPGTRRSRPENACAPGSAQTQSCLWAEPGGVWHRRPNILWETEAVATEVRMRRPPSPPLGNADGDGGCVRAE